MAFFCVVCQINLLHEAPQFHPWFFQIGKKTPFWYREEPPPFNAMPHYMGYDPIQNKIISWLIVAHHGRWEPRLKWCFHLWIACIPVDGSWVHHKSSETSQRLWSFSFCSFWWLQQAPATPLPTLALVRTLGKALELPCPVGSLFKKKIKNFPYKTAPCINLQMLARKKYIPEISKRPA